MISPLPAGAAPRLVVSQSTLGQRHHGLEVKFDNVRRYGVSQRLQHHLAAKFRDGGSLAVVGVTLVVDAAVDAANCNRATAGGLIEASTATMAGRCSTVGCRFVE